MHEETLLDNPMTITMAVTVAVVGAVAEAVVAVEVPVVGVVVIGDMVLEIKHLLITVLGLQLGTVPKMPHKVFIMLNLVLALKMLAMVQAPTITVQLAQPLGLG